EIANPGLRCRRLSRDRERIESRLASSKAGPSEAPVPAGTEGSNRHQAPTSPSLSRRGRLAVPANGIARPVVGRFRLCENPLPMRTLRIALSQINPTVGDLDGNFERIAAAIERARQQGADLLALPEMAITGYPPEDLLLKPSFIDRALERTRA